MKEENSGTADDDGKTGVTHLPSEEEANSQTAKDKEETRKTESGTGKFETAPARELMSFLRMY